MMLSQALPVTSAGHSSLAPSNFQDPWLPSCEDASIRGRLAQPVVLANRPDNQACFTLRQVSIHFFLLETSFQHASSLKPASNYPTSSKHPMDALAVFEQVTRESINLHHRGSSRLSKASHTSVLARSTILCDLDFVP